jgi:hypothetical protein
MRVPSAALWNRLCAPGKRRATAWRSASGSGCL